MSSHPMMASGVDFVSSCVRSVEVVANPITVLVYTFFWTQIHSSLVKL